MISLRSTPIEYANFKIWIELEKKNVIYEKAESMIEKRKKRGRRNK